jgi:hypothetical protein
MPLSEALLLYRRRRSAAQKQMICQHCKREPVTRPRGLCWSCYYSPGVRELYPSTSKYARRGFGNITGIRPLPARPTDTAPGTPERIEVYRERAKAGVCLFHPHDFNGLSEWPDWNARPGAIERVG